LHHLLRHPQILIILPFWYPALLAYAFPVLIPVLLILAVLLVRASVAFARRSRSGWRGVAWILAGYFGYVALVQILIGPVIFANHQWKDWLRSGAGIRKGMTQEEARASLEAKAIVSGGPLEFILRKKGPRRTRCPVSPNASKLGPLPLKV
jgi:hypothetical protein